MEEIPNTVVLSRIKGVLAEMQGSRGGTRPSISFLRRSELSQVGPLSGGLSSQAVKCTSL